MANFATLISRKCKSFVFAHCAVLPNLQFEMKNFNIFLVNAEERDYMSHEPMLTCLDPTEAYHEFHFKLRVTGFTYKFIYNLNSRHAYDDRIPIWKTGVAKGPKGAKAFAEAKKAFIDEMKLIGIRIGTLTII